MKKNLASVDQKTDFVGKNCFEALTFSLEQGGLYAINVFKIKEVIKIPPYSLLPNGHETLIGMADIRNDAIPIIDIGYAIGLPKMTNISQGYILVTEYNLSSQAFLVKNVNRIEHISWTDVSPIPTSSGDTHYLTASALVKDNIVGIIDVEKVLDLIAPPEIDTTKIEIAQKLKNYVANWKILVVDDSRVAVKQILKTLESVGFICIIANNGKQALEMLFEWSRTTNVKDKLLTIISDIEMPVMDGYTFVSKLKSDDRYRNIPVVMHTSLSGSFNKSMIEKVGANHFLPKFSTKRLIDLIQQLLEARISSLNL